jgi:hypothetical protein
MSINMLNRNKNMNQHEDHQKNLEMNSDVMKIIWRFMNGLCQDPVILGYPSHPSFAESSDLKCHPFAASFVSDVLHRLDAVVEGLIKPTTVAVSLGLFRTAVMARKTTI